MCNDYVAFEVVQVAEQLGIHVPDDLALKLMLRAGGDKRSGPTRVEKRTDAKRGR